MNLNIKMKFKLLVGISLKNNLVIIWEGAGHMTSKIEIGVRYLDYKF